MPVRDTDFGLWMTAQGFSGNEVARAGLLLGMSPKTAQLSYRGERELSLAERLAMSALRARLAPWTPEIDRELAGAAAIMAGVKALAAPQSAASG